MLGRTASNLFWMGRYMERAENVARLTEVGHRLSLTPDVGPGYREDWQATLAAAGCPDPAAVGLTKLESDTVQKYLLFDRKNPSSVASCLEAARTNGRSVRTALTREVWEALNAAWIEFAAFRSDDIRPDRLPELLDWVRQKTSLFRGAVQGTLLHDEGYRFLQLGNFIERSDNTARILDARYSVLLPTTEAAGGERGMYQWETILRSVSAHRSYRYVYKDRYRPRQVAEFLILRKEMPRSLRYSQDHVRRALNGLAAITGGGGASLALAEEASGKLRDLDIPAIVKLGLHEFLTEYLRVTAEIADTAATDYHFN
jgi:uncharacterized alpha-E superfamily protein